MSGAEEQGVAPAHTVNADGSINYPLQYPVTLTNGRGEEIEKITELHLRRLDGGGARKALNGYKTGPGDFAFELVCASARIPPSTFQRLDGEDVLAAVELASPFLGKLRPT